MNLKRVRETVRAVAVMADAGTVTGLFAVTAGVTGFYQVSRRADPFPVLMATALGYGATCLVGEFLDWGLAAAIAGVLALAVFIFRGQAIIGAFTKLISAKPAKESS